MNPTNFCQCVPVLYRVTLPQPQFWTHGMCTLSNATQAIPWLRFETCLSWVGLGFIVHNKVSAQHRGFITENEGNVFLPSLQHRASKNFFGFLFCHTNTFMALAYRLHFSLWRVTYWQMPWRIVLKIVFTTCYQQMFGNRTYKEI